MRRFAVISDVHANLEALDAVLRSVEGMDVFSLGDFVDYGANPNEVIESVRRRVRVSVLGNHDAAAVTSDTSLFNPRAAMSSRWTSARLTASSVEFLSGLPRVHRFEAEGVRVYMTHGSPDDNLWEYVDPRTHADLFGHYLKKTGSELMGLGHTHVPYVWQEEGRVVFNPGSVGQPRDRDRRASYAVVTIDSGRPEVQVVRVEYDYQRAASKIREAGLPVVFADRLAAGS